MYNLYIEIQKENFAQRLSNHVYNNSKHSIRASLELPNSLNIFRQKNLDSIRIIENVIVFLAAYGKSIRIKEHEKAKDFVTALRTSNSTVLAEYFMETKHNTLID